MKNYSQSDEQKAILAAFDGYPKGRFLDIGAYHPEVFSNTRALYELGWSGVMFEPSPEPFRVLKEEYGRSRRIELVQKAVATKEGKLTLHITKDAVSTSDPKHFEKWKAAGGYYGTEEVDAVTIQGILNQHGGFQFVNIDAEGQSVDLFKQLILSGMQPRCICVEYDDRKQEVLNLAKKAGYKVTYESGENLVMVI